MTRRVVLAVGSHPDDIELGCGGTLALHALKGDITHALVLTLGETSGDPKVRRKECLRAAKVLGLRGVTFGSFKDGRIPDGFDTIQVIEKAINDIRANLIYTHTFRDTHQDHRNTAQATLAAGRYVPNILMFETPSTLRDFIPNFYVDISGTTRDKVKATRLYRSQKGKFWIESRAIYSLMRYRGFQAKVQFAEAFEVAKFLFSL